MSSSEMPSVSTGSLWRMSLAPAICPSVETATRMSIGLPE